MDQFSTPVLLIIFNRPDTSRLVFNQIRKVKPRYLFVSADGPRAGKQGEKERCIEARMIIDQVDWECELKTLYRDENLGCRLAVSSAITWFFDNVDCGIILEDDCFPDISFFPFCETLLDKYKHDNRIFHINGTDFSGIKVTHPDSYYFTRFISIWGWATWKRAWQKFDLSMSDYQLTRNTILKKRNYISREASRHYKNGFDNMKIDEHNSWDAQWMYAVIKSEGLTITPNVNLVKNIGTSDSSTHSFLRDSFRDRMGAGKIFFPLQHPSPVESNNIDRLNFRNYRGKSLRRILRIVRENGIYNVIRYYMSVHLKMRFIPGSVKNYPA